MKLEHKNPQKLKKEIVKIIGKYLDLKKYRVFVFGSRARGKSRERSDIDIGIEGPRPVPGNIMVEIKEEIENLPVLYSIDVVDFKRVSPDFREVALQNTEVIK